MKARKVQFGQSNFLCFIPTYLCYYYDHQKSQRPFSMQNVRWASYWAWELLYSCLPFMARLGLSEQIQIRVGPVGHIDKNVRLFSQPLPHNLVFWTKKVGESFTHSLPTTTPKSNYGVNKFGAHIFFF